MSVDNTLLSPELEAWLQGMAADGEEGVTVLLLHSVAGACKRE